MPRKITINETPNPTGLSLTERQLALDVLQSLRVAVNKIRSDSQSSYYWNRASNWDAEQERETWDRAIRAAINQLAGRQKTENGHFKLIHNDTEVADKDLEYVLKSLGGLGT